MQTNDSKEPGLESLIKATDKTVWTQSAPQKEKYKPKFRNVSTAKVQTKTNPHKGWKYQQAKYKQLIEITRKKHKPATGKPCLHSVFQQTNTGGLPQVSK